MGSGTMIADSGYMISEGRVPYALRLRREKSEGWSAVGRVRGGLRSGRRLDSSRASAR